MTKRTVYICDICGIEGSHFKEGGLQNALVDLVDDLVEDERINHICDSCSVALKKALQDKATDLLKHHKQKEVIGDE